MSDNDRKLNQMVEAMRSRGVSRRDALKLLGLGGIGMLAGPALSRMALAGDQITGPGGIPLARPDNPVELPLHQDPIASGLEPETGGTFNLFNYADYVNPEMLDKFGEMYDVDVQLTTFDSMDQAITRLANRSVSVDATNISPDRIIQGVAGKLLQPLNRDYVPNLAETVWPELQDPFYDRGSQYTVPYTLYTTGVGWRDDMVEEDIPAMDNPWSIFWQAHDYKGRVGILNDSRESLCLGMAHREIFDVNTEDPEVIGRALEDLKALIPICNPRVDITNYQNIPQGTRALGQTWSGDMILGAMWYMPEDVPAENLRYWTGEPGSAWSQNDCWAIPVASQKPVLAHHWLNFLLDEQNAYDNFVNFTGYQPPLTALDPDRFVEDGIIPENLRSAVVRPEDVGPRSRQMMTLTNEGLALYQDAYAEFVAGL